MIHLNKYVTLRRALNLLDDCLIGPAVDSDDAVVPHLLGVLDDPVYATDAAFYLKRIDPVTFNLWCATQPPPSDPCGENPLCDPRLKRVDSNFEYLACRFKLAEARVFWRRFIGVP